MILSTAVLDATVPPLCPPIPSHNTNKEPFFLFSLSEEKPTLSSFAFLTKPTSVPSCFLNTIPKPYNL